MTVKELRTLVDNLDEYIHVPGGIERLKKTILHLAISGKLVPQDQSEGTAEELYRQIQAEKQGLIANGKLKKQKPLPPATEDNTPFELPASWKWAKMADISAIVTDGDHQAPPKADQGIPFLVIGDIRDGKLTPQIASRRVPDEYYKKLDWAHKPVMGDLLYTTVGSYGIPVSVEHDEEFCFQRHIGLIRPVKREMQDYFFYFLGSSFAFRQATDCATGIAQKTVPVSGIREFYVPLPPLIEQERIVRKIQTVFTLINTLSEKYKAEQVERTKLAISSLTQLSRGNGELALKHLSEIIRTKTDAAELRKTILHLAVSGELVQQDPSEGTGQELYDQIQAKKQKLVAEGTLKGQKPLPPITDDEVPFEIPKSWKWVRPAEVGEINPRNTIEDNALVGFTPMTMISEMYGVVPTYEKRLWKDVKKNLTHIASGDVVLAKITPCFENSKAGVIGDMPNRMGAATTEVHVFRQEDSLVNHQFIYAWFKSPTYLNVGKTKMTGTAGQKRIPTTFFATFIMPFPPRTEQERIVKKTTQLLKLVTELERSLEK